MILLPYRFCGDSHHAFAFPFVLIFLPLRLSCKESSTSNQAFLLRRKDVTALLSAVFLKSSRPSLPLKKAPPLISVFSPQGRRGKPPSGAQNRYALRLAGYQSPRHGCAGWDRQAVMEISLQLYC